jgi:SAM-dependent methyltransferase
LLETTELDIFTVSQPIIRAVLGRIGLRSLETEVDRRDAILKYTTKEQRGIEIGPWFNPIASKREGYRCLVLDVFDSETLRKRAADDPNIAPASIPMIEDVDLVGSSTQIAELVRARGEAGTFDYIVSSHNFEHLPNPIRFLQGCAEALKPGGVLSMAIPDRRACFDYFRPVTRLSDWIQAFVEDRSRPSFAQDFAHRELFAHYDDGKQRVGSFVRNRPPERVSAKLNLDRVFGDWMQRLRGNDENYHDAHCSVFTPSSFELLVRDAAYLGLAQFEVVEICDAGAEFHAHLRANRSTEDLRPANYEQTRNSLLHRIQNEAAETSAKYQEMRSALEGLGEAHERIRQLEETAQRLNEDNVCQFQLNKSIRGSLIWKLASPLWRLETRSARKKNRRKFPK